MDTTCILRNELIIHTEAQFPSNLVNVLLPNFDNIQEKNFARLFRVKPQTRDRQPAVSRTEILGMIVWYVKNIDTVHALPFSVRSRTPSQLSSTTLWRIFRR